MSTSQALRAGSAVAEQAGDMLRDTLSVLATTRAHLLVFSLPFLWAWSEGLPLAGRFGLLVAHGGALTGLATANSIDDQERGIEPRLGVTRGWEGCRPELARQLPEFLLLLSVAGLASLFAAAGDWRVGASVLVLLIGGWGWMRLPLSVKYLVQPELAAPIVALLVPWTVLTIATPVAVPVTSVLAGVAGMATLVLAAHLRDRELDLADDVPTSATRRPELTRRWLKVTGAVASIATLAGLYVPLTLPEGIGLLGALGILVATTRDDARMTLLVPSFALAGLYWLFG